MGPEMSAVFIPIVALLIPIFALYFGYKREALKRQERMKAIEKGVDVPQEPAKKPLEPHDYFRRGLITIAVGIGLFLGGTLLSTMTGEKEAALGFWLFAPVVLLVGIAIMIYYATIKRREK